MLKLKGILGLMLVCGALCGCSVQDEPYAEGDNITNVTINFNIAINTAPESPAALSNSSMISGSDAISSLRLYVFKENANGDFIYQGGSPSANRGYEIPLTSTGDEEYPIIENKIDSNGNSYQIKKYPYEFSTALETGNYKFIAVGRPSTGSYFADNPSPLVKGTTNINQFILNKKPTGVETSIEEIFTGTLSKANGRNAESITLNGSQTTFDAEITLKRAVAGVYVHVNNLPTFQIDFSPYFPNYYWKEETFLPDHMCLTIAKASTSAVLGNSESCLNTIQSSSANFSAMEKPSDHGVIIAEKILPYTAFHPWYASSNEENYNTGFTLSNFVLPVSALSDANCTLCLWIGKAHMTSEDTNQNNITSTNGYYNSTIAKFKAYKLKINSSTSTGAFEATLDAENNATFDIRPNYFYSLTDPNNSGQPFLLCETNCIYPGY